MTFDTGLFLFLGALFIFFFYLSISTGKKVFNLLDIGILMAMMIGRLMTDTTVIVVAIGLILYLLFDLFWGKRKGEFE
jgi:flagellar biosynthesis protein FlhB